MKAYNRKKRPKNMTFPRYKGYDFQVQRNVKRDSVNSVLREKRCIIHNRYSYKYTFEINRRG